MAKIIVYTTERCPKCNKLKKGTGIIIEMSK